MSVVYRARNPATGQQVAIKVLHGLTVNQTHRQRFLREVEAICMRCLEKDPADRFPSMRTLSNALERYLKPMEPAARKRLPLGLIAAPAAARWTRRRGFFALPIRE